MALAGQASPEYRRWTLDVIRQVTPKDYLSEVAAIFYAICRRVRYTRDPFNTEEVAHPLTTVEVRAGDCDDGATAAAAGAGIAADGHGNVLRGGTALAAVGNQVEFVAIGFRPDQGFDPYSHVATRTRDPKTGEWAVLDFVAGPWTRDMLKRVRHLRTVSVGGPR